MAEVKVLVEGNHSMIGGGKVKIGSTVTLIKTDKNILVDTGSFLDKEEIINKLRDEGLIPEKIDIVILTHLHLDHIINTYLFKNAKIFCKFNPKYPGQFHVPQEGCLQKTNLLENTEIARDVKVILTPGHTLDMISVIVNTPKGKIVITGDALSSEEWADLKKQPMNVLVYDIKKYNESRKKVLEIADYIIPGHGKMFKVKK